MKKIIGYGADVGYDLERFGDKEPKIEVSGSVRWEQEGVSGFRRVESVQEAALSAHLFCDWQKELLGFWQVQEQSDRGGEEKAASSDESLGSWVAVVEPKTKVQWLSEKLNDQFDVLQKGLPDTKAITSWDKAVRWEHLQIADDERFLQWEWAGQVVVLNAKNVMMVLERTHSSLAAIMQGQPQWVWGRAGVVINKTLMPVVNVIKSTWSEQQVKPCKAALVMPYKTQSGQIVSWVALVGAAPKMVGKKQIDQQVKEGLPIAFLNESALLGMALQGMN